MRHIAIALVLGVAWATLGLAGGPSSYARRDEWGAEQRAVLASLRLSELPDRPDDPSNAWQDSAAAAALGKRLFFDTRFSRNQAVSCASCHDPDRQFQDGRPVGQGVGVGTRRTMPIVAAGYSSWLFWDGRKDSLWSQALGPLEDPAEHGGNRLRYTRLLQTHYREDYVSLFGPLPAFSQLPDDASPLGSITERNAWYSLSPTQRDAISRVFANMGKAIAAYERTLRHEPSRLDLYLEQALSDDWAAQSVFTPQEVEGLRLFIGKAQCVSCHGGPLLTDQQFHNTGVAATRAGKPDAGRAAAVAKVRNDEFNCLGRYSDAREAQCQELRFLSDDVHYESAFKTPSLRGVARRPPYMHAGQLATLEEAVSHYIAAPKASTGKSELRPTREAGGRSPIRLSSAEQLALVAFLQTL